LPAPLEMVERRDEGIIVSGACVTSALGPLAEELIVFPPRDIAHGSESRALLFAINTNARGLLIRCDEPKPAHGDARPHPLDELPCVAIFHHVLIPWERVFLCGDIERSAAVLEISGAALNLRHQQAVRGLAAAEFRLADLAMVGRTAGLAFPRIREMLYERMIAIRLAHGLLDAAVGAAQPDRWGQWRPDTESVARAAQIVDQI
jgi:aromatic ring hydroxylase